MTASNAMLAHRYGYGLGRGPRRMPPRMQTSLMGTEEFGIDIPDEEFETALRQVQGAAERLSRFKGENRPKTNKFDPNRFSPMTLPAIPFGYGGIDSAVADDMFGADDDEDADDAEMDDGDAGDAGEQPEKKGFKMPKLPGWALPAAAIAAGTAGAVGLGLALTSKKRKAKKAARAASEESFGAMGDLVAEGMFGNPEDDEFGDDPFAPPPFFSSPLPPQPPPVQPATPPIQSAASPFLARSGVPSWSQYKAAQRDLYRAVKRSTKASDRLAKAQSGIPALPTTAPVFGSYGCNWNRPRKTAYGAVIPSSQDLQSFVSSLSNMNAKALYSKSVEFVTAYVGRLRAVANMGSFEKQYESFRQAAQQEGGLGPRASAEAAKGISLVESISGTPVSTFDRQAMTAVARAQAGLIARGLA